jgi:hypothetical protein
MNLETLVEKETSITDGFFIGNYVGKEGII